MRFWLSTFIALVAPLSASSAANELVELAPRCGGPFQLCGYVEKGSEAPRISEGFEVAQPFSSGLAAVRIDGQWGFIDPAGNIVIAPRFKAAGPFGGDYAEVRIGNASGIIDRSGRVVIPARFDRIVPFSNGTFLAAPMRDNRRSADPTDGRLGGFTDPLVLLGQFGGGLYDIRKSWLTDQDLNFDHFDAPERGLIWAGKRNTQGDDEWGLMRSDGTWQVSPRYSHVQRVMETHAVVKSMPDYVLPAGERHDGVRWGAVDRNGKLVVPLTFAYLSYWRGGYGYAKEGKPYNSNGTENQVGEGIVRAGGSLLGDRYFDKVDIREDGTLPRGRVGRRWYSIEPSGRPIPDQLDGKPLVECAGGLTIVQRGEEVEFLRPSDGRPVGRFETGYFQERDCPGPFSAKRKAKWFYVMEDGRILGGRNGFDSTYSFSGTYSPVQVDGKWGIIDRSGTYTVEPRFAKLRPDRNGTYAVDEGEGTYWIDASGKRVEKPAIARPTPEQALTCQGGLRYFQKEGFWGLQDGSGRTVIEPRFRALSCFKQGITWTASPGGTAWCPLGPDGKRREAMDCSQTYYPMILTHHSPEKFSDNSLENSVLWTRAWLDYQAGRRAAPPKWIPDFGNGGTYSVMEGRVSVEGISSAPSGERTSLPAIAILGSLFAGLIAHWWWENTRPGAKR